MTHRAYCENLPQPPVPVKDSSGTVSGLQNVVLDGAEARHLSSVLRLGPGDAVELFDGRGAWAGAEIVGVGRREIELAIRESGHDAAVQGPELVMATAIPKGDRVRSLVEKLTELGVDRLVPLKTRHSVVHPRDSKLKKMQQAVISACKQCGRNRLMRIDGLTGWDELLAVENQSLVIAERGAATVGESSVLVPGEVTGSLVLCVGPEGGWSVDELVAAEAAGATRVGLGRHVLRIETAAVALAAAAGFFSG